MLKRSMTLAEKADKLFEGGYWYPSEAFTISPIPAAKIRAIVDASVVNATIGDCYYINGAVFKWLFLDGYKVKLPNGKVLLNKEVYDKELGLNRIAGFADPGDWSKMSPEQAGITKRTDHIWISHAGKIYDFANVWGNGIKIVAYGKPYDELGGPDMSGKAGKLYKALVAGLGEPRYAK